MGRSPSIDASVLKKGPWTPEEDQKLITYIQQYGHGSWRSLPQKAGLHRCGKSCRLRWTNYLRPDIKRGKFSLHEEQTIIQLHALLGNRWSAIAAHLPKRTDNEIKNYWNTHLKKRLAMMGIDPVTHKPTTLTLGSAEGDLKNASNLSHTTQWESARLEAEARLVRDSKQRQNEQNNSSGSITASAQVLNKLATRLAPLPCLDILKAWQNVCIKSIESGTGCVSDGYKAPFSFGFGDGSDIESPTCTLNFPKSTQAMSTIGSFNLNGILGTCGDEINEVFATGHHNFKAGEVWTMEPSKIEDGIFMEGFSNILLDDKQSLSISDTNANTSNGSGGDGAVCEENKNYWNDILNLVKFGPLNSPVYSPIF